MKCYDFVYLFADGTKMKILPEVLQPLRKSVPLVDRQKPATICFEVSSKTFWKIETANAIFWKYLGGTAKKLSGSV